MGEYRYIDIDRRIARTMINLAARKALAEDEKSRKEDGISCLIFAATIIVFITGMTISMNWA